MSLMSLLLTLNLAALVALVALQLQLRRQARHLTGELNALAPELAQKPSAAEPAGAGRQVISIEILNPLELAANESWFGDKLGSLTPELLRRIVNERTVKDLRQQLQSHGVKAEVQLLRG